VWDIENGVQVGDPLRGHNGAVLAVAFSPDGTKLVSGGADTRVIYWNVSTGELDGSPSNSSGSVYSLAFSPDGTLLASAGADTKILVWTVADRQQIRTLKGHVGSILSVAFGTNGSTLTLVTAGADRTVGVFEPNVNQRVGSILTQPPVRIASITLSPDGGSVASGAFDGSVALWDRTTGKSTGPSIAGHSLGQVNSLAFSPDGKTLASAGSDKTIMLWDVASGLPDGPALQGHTESVTSLAYSPDGKWLASGSLDKTIVFWDTSSHTPIATLGKNEQIGAILSLAVSPDGGLLASGGDDSTVSLWEVPSHKRIEPLLVGHMGTVRSLAFSPDGKTLASGSLDSTVRFWDVQTHQSAKPPIDGHSAPVFSVAFSQDGQTLASAGMDTTIILWDVKTGQRSGPPLVGHRSWIHSLVFSGTKSFLLFDRPESLLSVGDNDFVVDWNLSSDYVATTGCRMANRNLTLAEWRLHFGTEPYALTCPNLSVNRWAIGGVIKNAEALLAAGKTASAQEAYASAVEWAKTTGNWSLNNALCWFGSLDGLASTVMPACDRAVEVAPDDEKPNYRDSRGVARAQMRDFAGAIEDFSAYVDWAQHGSARLTTLANKRGHWLTELQAGRNPFEDRSILEALHDE
jgi:WD40 repeat protein